MDLLSFEQLRLVIVVYLSALMPLILIPILHRQKLIPSWVLRFYGAMFVVCALGWELWFNYGLVAGDSVSVRRVDILNQMIPLHINGLLNSLADAGTICCGGLLLVWLLMGRGDSVYREWNWRVFSLLMVIFIGQNIFVEMFLYRDQLADGKHLSWAPLSPLGMWFDPILFQFNDRSIRLSSQLPWLILTPLLYLGLIRLLPQSKSSQNVINQ
ncbi:MAG: hypothetical protein P8P12_04040 [Porticoccaceae bacterium]|nr:hypothetical protein [Porticoccaceae bacterium]